jgi:murein DD-endopeptidase MepM/ murein hydrolase activator NlpD
LVFPYTISYSAKKIITNIKYPKYLKTKIKEKEKKQYSHSKKKEKPAFMPVIDIKPIQNLFSKNDTIKLNKHVVKKGETLYEISQNTGIDIAIIIENNPKLKKKNGFKVGTILKIPSKNGLYYTIKDNSNIKEIAKKYNVDIDDITLIKDIDGYGESEIKVFVENPDILFSKKSEINKKTNKKYKKLYLSYHNDYNYNVMFGPPCHLKGVTSAYGVRFHPILKREVFHEGVDLKGKTGDPVFAAKNGIVIFAGNKSGYGNLIIINHGNGYSTRYGHLNSIGVRKGKEVLKGAYIGEIGSTGRSTGPHLHFEIRKDGETISPMKYIKNNKNSFSNIDTIISEVSKKVDIDEQLISLVANQESGKNQGVISNKGAIGVMQLMPATAKSLGVNPYDTRQNIEGGARYLKELLKQFNGNIELTLAAYNAGPNNVIKYNGVPPFKETIAYVNKIMKEYNN